MSTYVTVPGLTSYRDQQGFEHTYDTRELAYRGAVADLAGLEALSCACQRRAVTPAVPVQLNGLAEVERGTLSGLLTDLALLAGVSVVLGGAVWFFAVRK